MAEKMGSSVALSLVFGASAPSIAEQLRRQGLLASDGAVTLWQRDADAITRLAIRQLLPDAAIRTARKNLLKRVAKGVQAEKGRKASTKSLTART